MGDSYDTRSAAIIKQIAANQREREMAIQQAWHQIERANDLLNRIETARIRKASEAA